MTVTRRISFLFHFDTGDKPLGAPREYTARILSLDLVGSGQLRWRVLDEATSWGISPLEIPDGPPLRATRAVHDAWIQLPSQDVGFYSFHRTSGLPRGLDPTWLIPLVAVMEAAPADTSEDAAYQLFWHLVAIPAAYDPNHWFREHMPRAAEFFASHVERERGIVIGDVMDS